MSARVSARGCQVFAESHVGIGFRVVRWAAYRVLLLYDTFLIGNTPFLTLQKRGVVWGQIQVSWQAG